MARKIYTGFMTTQIISRLAPTPSGELHLGNIFNFILTWWFVRSQSGVLALRIDDFDGLRTKREWIEEIFKNLDRLGMDWDQGPSGVEDFEIHFSQQRKKDFYWEKLQVIKENLFVCECSNSSWKGGGHDGYPGTCLHQDHQFHALKNKIRLNYKNPKLASDLCYPIMWRKDDFPSYQLISVIEDDLLKTTHLIRGLDLYDSTLFQKDLSKLLKLQFPKASYHHALVVGADGKKLSKSQGSDSLPDTLAIFKMFCSWVKIPKVSNLQDLLKEPFPLEVFTNPMSN